MGMDVYGNNGNYFRANIWSWRAICYAIELSGYEVPDLWHSNDGAGLDDQHDCDLLAGKLEVFLKSWDGNILVACSNMRVDKSGRFVDPGTPESTSPYKTSREHLQEFIDFLKECEGFQIF